MHPQPPASLIDIESRAVFALIRLAPADGDTSAEAHTRARFLCCRTIRRWRQVGRRDRAKWFRSHMSTVGYPFKPSEPDHCYTNRRAAFIRRYWPKWGLEVPAWAVALAA